MIEIGVNFIRQEIYLKQISGDDLEISVTRKVDVIYYIYRVA
jgi:hypothetical protein